MATPHVPGQIDAVKIDIKLLDKHLKQLGLKMGGAPEERAQRLQEKYIELERKGELSAGGGYCTECGAYSDMGLAACPVCGDATQTDEASVEAEEVEVVDVAPDDATEVAPAASKSKAKKPAAKAKPATKSKAAAVQAAAKPNGKANGKGAHAAAAAASIVKVPGKPAKSKLAKHTAQDLDAECERVRSGTLGAANSLWEVGQALSKIHEGELWKLRSVEGVPVHTSFNRFVVEEFNMSHVYAYKVMEVAKHYDAATIAKLGPTKLHLLLKAPDDKKAAATRAAAAGATARQIRDEVRGQPLVTMVVKAGQQVLPALSRTKKDKHGGVLPARSIKEDPWCEVQLENNARLIVKLIQGPEGELSFLVLTMRADQTQEQAEAQPIEVAGESV